MVALQDTIITISNGQLAQRSCLERVIVTRVVDIVANRSQEDAENLETVQVPNGLGPQNALDRVEYVKRVVEVMISIVSVPVLDPGDERLYRSRLDVVVLK
jgi:hypothetical protein